MTEEENAFGFASSEFFLSQELDCYFTEKGFPLTKKHLLPDINALFHKDSFATVSMGWNMAALFWQITVHTKNIAVSYPDITKGDSIEFFIDTRDVKQAKTTHRYCHHFFFLPEAIDGHTSGEITRFRTDDSHPLAASSDLECTMAVKGSSYQASICIPATALVGYSPDECSRIGFTYRINRNKAEPQLFGLSERVSRIEYIPYLWNTLNFRKS